MGVDSYLELFVTMYGWAFSAVLRDIVVSTGLCFIPFGVIIVRTWIEAHESMAVDGADAAWMVRKMEVELGVAIVVLTLCFATSSITSVSQMKLTYTEDATTVNPSPTRVTAADSGSTYNAAFRSAPATVEVPLFWYAVMSLSSGITEAAKAGIASNREGFRELEAQVQAATIADPQLRAEVQRFQNECFVPARSRFLVAQPPSSAAQTAMSTYGSGDTEWMGSHAFRTDENLYPALFAQAPVPGWPVDSLQDGDVAANDVKPEAGRPNCEQWWSDGSLGVRSKLIAQLGTLSETIQKLKLVGVDNEKSLDALAKVGVEKSRPKSMTSQIGNDRGFMQTITAAVPEALGTVGAYVEGFAGSAIRGPLIDSIEMAQPLILMALYMFMPLALLVSCYSLRAMVAGGLAIATVKLWPFMWFVARWLDDNLIGALYPDADSFLNHFLHCAVDFEGFQKRAILNFVLVGCYIGFPLIWSGMMAWAGVRAMHGIGEMQHTAARSGVNAGNAGTKLVR